MCRQGRTEVSVSINCRTNSCQNGFRVQHAFKTITGAQAATGSSCPMLLELGRPAPHHFTPLCPASAAAAAGPGSCAQTALRTPAAPRSAGRHQQGGTSRGTGSARSSHGRASRAGASEQAWAQPMQPAASGTRNCHTPLNPWPAHRLAAHGPIHAAQDALKLLVWRPLRALRHALVLPQGQGGGRGDLSPRGALVAGMQAWKQAVPVPAPPLPSFANQAAGARLPARGCQAAPGSLAKARGRRAAAARRPS